MSKRSGEKPWSGGRKRSEAEAGAEATCAVLRVRKPEARAKNFQRKPGGRTKAEPTESGRAEAEGRSPEISGDNSLRDPPVPIPNTEVKPQHADSTWLETAR